MEVLVLDGKNYVKASKAAKELGYATDYVGQLCRSGQVDAHLIGRTWYVNQEQLGSHRVEKKRISRVKAREQAKKAIEEHRLKVTETTNTYKNIDIQYEGDDRELIPTPKISPEKKLEIKSESAHAKAIAEAEFEETGGNIIENPGDKVLMKGDLTVVDVTDGPSDDDTVTLTPRMIRRKPETKVEEKVLLEKSVEVSGEGGESTVIQIQKQERKIPTFTERLGIEAITPDGTTEDTVGEDPATAEIDPQVQKVLVTAPEQQVVAEPRKETKSASVLPFCFAVFVILTGVLSTLPLSATFEYDYEDQNNVTTRFRYSYSDTIDKIQLKIKESRLNKI